MLNRKDKPNLSASMHRQGLLSIETADTHAKRLKPIGGTETSRSNFSVSTMSVRSRELSPVALVQRHDASITCTPTSSQSNIHKLGSNRKQRYQQEEFEIREPQVQVVPLTETSFITDNLPYNYRNSQRRILYQLEGDGNEWLCCFNRK